MALITPTSLWYLVRLNTGERVYLKVMNQFTFGSQQSIIKYEHPGTNGGTIKNNGRLNETAALNCNIIGDSLDEVQKKVHLLKFIKENGEQIRLVGPFQYSETGRYQIEGIAGGIEPGATKNSIITITLAEDREYSTKISSISLVASQPYEEFLKVYRAQTGQQ